MRVSQGVGECTDGQYAWPLYFGEGPI